MSPSGFWRRAQVLVRYAGIAWLVFVVVRMLHQLPYAIAVRCAGEMSLAAMAIGQLSPLVAAIVVGIAVGATTRTSWIVTAAIVGLHPVWRTMPWWHIWAVGGGVCFLATRGLRSWMRAP